MSSEFSYADYYAMLKARELDDAKIFHLLVAKIMENIGFDQHYSYFEGSRSCKELRVQAVAKLEGELRKAHESGLPVIPIDQNVISFVKYAAREGDKEITTLHDTWMTARMAIVIHIRKAMPTDLFDKID